MRTALKIAAMLLIALGCWLWLDTPSAEQAPASPRGTQPAADRLTTHSAPTPQRIQKSEPVEGADKPKPCMPPLVSGTRPAISEDAMAAWKNVLPKGPWTNSEVYVLLDAIDKIGVYAADVLPLGQQASLDVLAKESALAGLSTAQLEALAEQYDAEAWRLLGLQEINSAWGRIDGVRRIKNIATWKAGIEKLGRAAALGNERALAQAVATSYLAVWTAAQRQDPHLSELRIVMHAWHQLATLYGNSANTMMAAANVAQRTLEMFPAATRLAMAPVAAEEASVTALVESWRSRLENVFPMAPSMREKLIEVGGDFSSLSDNAFPACT